MAQGAPMSVRFTDEQKERLKAWAADRGLKIHAAVLEAVDLGMGVGSYLEKSAEVSPPPRSEKVSKVEVAQRALAVAEARAGVKPRLDTSGVQVGPRLGPRDKPVVMRDAGVVASERDARNALWNKLRPAGRGK